MNNLYHIESLIKDAVVQAGHEVSLTVDKWKMEIEKNIIDIVARKAAELTITIIYGSSNTDESNKDSTTKKLESEFIEKYHTNVKALLIEYNKTST
jgi:hypothetical protein